MKFWSLFLAVTLTTSAAYAAAPTNILGSWKTEGGDSQLNFYPCGGKICGKIVWLKVPRYIDSKDGPVGKTKVDRKNPNPALRSRPILGLPILKELRAKGDRKWGDGKCYDPESGKSYRCEMHLTTPRRLELRGYVGVSMIGRSFVLTR